MSAQTLYLAMVICGFVAFGVTLFGVSLWQRSQRD